MGKRTFTERARLAAQGEAVGEEVENFVFLHLSPYSHHERQAQKTKSFLLEILLNRGASQMAKGYAAVLACNFRVCKFL